MKQRLFIFTLTLFAVLISRPIAAESPTPNVWVPFDQLPFPRVLQTKDADRHLLHSPSSRLFIAAKDTAGNHYVLRFRDGLDLEGGYQLGSGFTYQFMIDQPTNWLIVDRSDGKTQLIDWQGDIVREFAVVRDGTEWARPQVDGTSIFLFEKTGYRAFHKPTNQLSETITFPEIACAGGGDARIVETGRDPLAGILYVVHSSADCTTTQPSYTLQIIDPVQPRVLRSVPLGKSYHLSQNDSNAVFLRHSADPNVVTYALLTPSGILRQQSYPAQFVPPTHGLGVARGELLIERVVDKQELLLTNKALDGRLGQVGVAFGQPRHPDTIFNVSFQSNSLLYIEPGSISLRPIASNLSLPIDWPPAPSPDDCIIPPTGPWPPCATGGGDDGGSTGDCVIPPSGPWPPCATGGDNSGGSTSDCVIPPSGPWPPCATGGGNDNGGAGQPCPASGKWPPGCVPPGASSDNVQFTNLTQFTSGKLAFNELAALDGYVYFMRDDGVWRSDGTTMEQLPIPAEPVRSTFTPSGLTVCNDSLFISTGAHFWVINEHGWPVKLRDRPMQFAINSDNRCFFSSVGEGFPYTHDLFLWEATTAGVRQVAMWHTGGGTTLYSFVSIEGGRFAFVKGHPSPKANVDSNIYISDGQSMTDIGAGRNVMISLGTTLFRGNSGYFGSSHWVAYNLNGERLFSMPTQYPSMLAKLNEMLYFVAAEEDGSYALWRTDGTESGTVKITAVPGYAGGNGVVVDGRIYFILTSGANGRELWMTDGTHSGTRLVKDILFGSGSTSPLTLTSFGNHLYFTAEDGKHGRELWRTNGTQTERLTDINPNGDSFPSYILNAVFAHEGNHLYFIGWDEDEQAQVWQLAVQP